MDFCKFNISKVNNLYLFEILIELFFELFENKSHIFLCILLSFILLFNSLFLFLDKGYLLFDSVEQKVVKKFWSLYNDKRVTCFEVDLGIVLFNVLIASNILKSEIFGFIKLLLLL